MRTAISIAKILHFLLAALLVVACGGGGGGGVVVPPPAGVSITAANAELITATIVKAAGIAEGVGGGLPILSGVAVKTSASGFSYPDFFVKQLQRLPALASQFNTGSVTGVVFGPFLEDCADITGGTSGTYIASGDISDPTFLTLTVGDNINLVFNACVIDGIEMNGGIDLTVSALLPATNFDFTLPYTLGMDAVLSNFSANEAGFVVTGDGDMSILLDENTSGDLVTILSGTSLLTTAGSDAVQLTNYQFRTAENLITGDYSFELAGTIASTAIGGSVIYATTTPFTGNDFGPPNATVGELHITTTADSSQALVTALSDGINVDIDVDVDGDSTYEITIPTTWTALQTP